jgi:hypothetical protein
MKRTLLVILLMLLLSNICYSTEKMSYFISYDMTFRGKTSIMRVYCQNSERVRIEFESTIEKVINGVKGSETSISSTIYHINKDTSIILDDHAKVAYEQKLSEKNLLLLKNFTGEAVVTQGKKIGEDVILGHPCDGYLFEGKNKITNWVAKENNLILKFEQGEGDFKTITEAKEYKLEKLSDNLFEVPSNYRVVQTVISSEEDVKKEPPVTLDLIQGLLFENVDSISILLPEKEFRKLSKEEINILKIAIKNGTELQETNNREVFTVSSSSTKIVFDLSWVGNTGCNIWYDKASGFLYVNKVDVHRRDQEKHKFDSRWIKKYLVGAYKLKPSEEIMKVLK